MPSVTHTFFLYIMVIIISITKIFLFDLSVLGTFHVYIPLRYSGNIAVNKTK